MFHFHNSRFFENTPAPKRLHEGHNPYETTNGKLMLKDKAQGKIGRRFGNDLTNQHSIKPQTLFIDYDFKKNNCKNNNENNTICKINNENIEATNNQKQEFLNENCLKIEEEEESIQLNENENDEVEYCPNNTSWVPNMDDIINEIDLDHAFETIASYRSFISSRNIQNINLDITDDGDDEHFDLISINDISYHSPKNSILENIIQNHCQLPLENSNDEFEPFPLLLQFDADIIDDDDDDDDNNNDNDDNDDNDIDVE